jgi:hypothetical protein
MEMKENENKISKLKHHEHKKSFRINKEKHQQMKHILKSAHLPDYAGCPIHPHSNHKWGDCHANANNHKNDTKPKLTLKTKAKDKDKSPKDNGNAMEMEDASIACKN